MAIRKALIATFALLAFFAISNAYAQSQSQCVEKVIKTGTASGRLVGIMEEENRYYLKLDVDNDDWYVPISTDEINSYSPFINKDVAFSYTINQYWDEHDEECIQEKSIKSLKAK